MPGPVKYTSLQYQPNVDDLYLLRTAQALLFRSEPLLTTDEVLVRLKSSRRQLRNTEAPWFLELVCEERYETDVQLDFELDAARIIHRKRVLEKELIKYRQKATQPLLILVPEKDLIPVSDVKQVLAEFSQIETISELVQDLTNKLEAEYHTHATVGITVDSLRKEIENLLQIQTDVKNHKNSLKTIDEATKEAQETLDLAAEKEGEIQLLIQEQERARQTLTATVSQKQRLVNECKEIEEQLYALERTIEQRDTMNAPSSTSNMRMKIDPPIWVRRPNQTQRESTVTYCREMKLVKEMDPSLTDKQLIYSSLSKSGKMDVYEELAQTEREDVQKFCEYLERIYGGNDEDIREELNKASQKPNESYPSWFRRCAALYLRSRGESNLLPNLSSITDEQKQKDIRYHYLRGLRSSAVSQHLRTATDKVPFAELGQKAQIVSEVLETTPLASVNQVSTECLDHSDVMNKLVTAITNVTERICALEKIGKERCDDCGWFNHSSKDCRASAKTTAKFRSRGGSRDHSRDRYRGRTFDTRYDRHRSSSVGRTPYRRRSYSRVKLSSRSNLKPGQGVP